MGAEAVKMVKIMPEHLGIMRNMRALGDLLFTY